MIRHDHTTEFPTPFPATKPLSRREWISIFVIAMLLVVLTSIAPDDAHALTPRDADKNAGRVTRVQAERHGHHSVAYRKWLIQAAWGADATLGLRIAYCESGYRLDARDYANGTHWGLFQMGWSERKTYQHGSGAMAQAKGAYAYYKFSGTSPWKSSKHCWKAS